MADKSTTKLGRNDACPCGSGKKYKRCCLRLGEQDPYRRTPPKAAGSFDEKPRSWKLADWPSHRTSFLAPAAAAVAEGHDLPDYVVPAWVCAQVRNRLRVTGGFVEVCLRKVRVLETEVILTQLAEYGVVLDENRFVAGSESYSSAWAFAETVSDQHKKKDAEWVGLAFCELWRRYLDRPSLEMLDEQMQDGYDFVEDGEFAHAANTWLSFASALLALMPESAHSMTQVDGWFPGLSSVANWYLDFEELLHEVAAEPNVENQAVALSGAELHLRWAEHLSSDEEFVIAARRAHADLLFFGGKPSEAEAVLRGLIETYPKDAGAYVVLTELWMHTPKPSEAIRERCMEILRQALDVPVRDSKAWSIPERLKQIAI